MRSLKEGVEVGLGDGKVGFFFDDRAHLFFSGLFVSPIFGIESAGVAERGLDSELLWMVAARTLGRSRPCGGKIRIQDFGEAVGEVLFDLQEVVGSAVDAHRLDDLTGLDFHDSSIDAQGTHQIEVPAEHQETGADELADSICGGFVDLGGSVELELCQDGLEPVAFDDAVARAVGQVRDQHLGEAFTQKAHVLVGSLVIEVQDGDRGARDGCGPHEGHSESKGTQHRRGRYTTGRAFRYKRISMRVRQPIYCNRTLNFRSLAAVGYDMDYTLIHYHVPIWEEHAYLHVLGLLRDRGWPVEGLEFRPDFIIRGLVVDTELGNVVKPNRFGFIKQACHGTRPLPFEMLRETYSRVIIDLAEPRWRFLNTFFSVSEGCLFMQLVERLDEGRLSGVATYNELYHTIRETMDRAHLEGRLTAAGWSSPSCGPAAL